MHNHKYTISLLNDAISKAEAIVSSVAGHESPVLRPFELMQNYPNPFHPSTVVTYQIPRAGRVTVCIYSVIGRKVRRLVEQVQAAGLHRVSWDGTNERGNAAPSGEYLCRVEYGHRVKMPKMTLLRWPVLFSRKARPGARIRLSAGPFAYSALG